jgi:hypothetical protein
VWSEANRFSTKHSNMFICAFSQILQYLEFLNIILKRHKKVTKIYLQKRKVFQKSIQEHRNGTLNTYQLKLLDKLRMKHPVFHLDIESFYLFSKILLDKVSRFIEFYFGKVRSKSFDSHDKLVKNLSDYVKAKGINLPKEFEKTVKRLQKDVSDFRDKEIAHEKSPRTIRGISIDDKGQIAISSTRLYPTETNNEAQTKYLNELLNDINIYLDQVIRLVSANKDRTNLKLKDIENLERV